MKPSEFYSTITNYPVGNTSGQFTEQQTKSVYTIYTETGSVSEEAYWLGWIKKENLPLNMQHNHWVVDGDGDSKTVKFINDTDLANFPCGYVKRGSYSYTYSTRFITDGVARRYDNSVWWTYFLNDLHPEYSAAVESSYFIYTAIVAFVYYKNSGVNVPRGYDEIWTRVIEFRQDAGYTLKDCIDFLEGNKTITITSHNINGNYYTFDITIDDDLKTLGYKEFTSNEDVNITMMYILANIRLPFVICRNGNSSDYFLSQFAAKITWTDNDNETSGDYNITNGSNYYNIIAAIIDGTISRYDDNSGAEGEFNYNELMRMGNDDYIINGNIFVANVYDRVRFHNIRNAADLLRAFSLIYRVDTSGYNTPVSSYVDGVTYATDVSSANEFLARLKTGNISDDEFRDGLRYWQYSTITNNDFDEDDVPPYEPPEPPDEGEESGDLIDNQYRYFGASKFITQYALTRSQLELFGEKLWTSWADTLGNPTEMWKNFKMFIGGGGDTGSIDISTVMNFIVSLRVFPYDLTDSLMQDVNGIRLGRGEYPIDVGVVKKMISLIQYVDFGTITVPRPFGDYRDYENMNISLVLPYCGTTMLNPGDVVGRNLTCTYAVDLQAGTCEAFVYVTNSGDTGAFRYNVAQMSGQIGALLPVSATNSGQIMTQRITDAASVAATIVSPLDSLPSTIMGAANDNMNGAALHKAANIAPILGALNPELYGGISDVANALSRPAISCPSLGGGSGLSAFHQPASPYIQMRYGKYTEPDNYNHAVGRPSTDNGTLSSYSGYVVCTNVDVSSLTCHTDEKAAIKAALESGVYV